MTGRTPRAGAPAWTLAVTAMLSVQLGSALSMHVISSVGAAGTAWLRLSIGTLMFWAIARPPLRAVRRHDLPVLLGLGFATGVQTIAFLSAIERIPLGTSVAIEFLGPLTVAAARGHSRRALLWPALALVGVSLLTQPWHGQINAAGICYAAVAAVGWAFYIVLTQQVGDRFSGMGGLSLTVPIAALTSGVVGVPQALGHLSVGTLAAAAGLAVLLPVLPYACELIALRKLSSSAYGTLMAIEPAIGVLLGLFVLRQHPTIAQGVGILLVVTAGAASQRKGARRKPALSEPESMLTPLG